MPPRLCGLALAASLALLAACDDKELPPSALARGGSAGSAGSGASGASGQSGKGGTAGAGGTAGSSGAAGSTAGSAGSAGAAGSAGTAGGGGMAGLKPCLDQPTTLPRPAGSGLPCDLLPPGFGK